MTDMSKITFRADDELVDAIESFDASKSEVMREALRSYLEAQPEVDLGAVGSETDQTTTHQPAGSIDELIVERIDELLDQRLDQRLGRGRRHPQDVNVSITLDGVSDAQAPEQPNATVESSEPAERKTREADERSDAEAAHTCGQCGETLSDDHVFCPNCGEKASRRLFCDCGDELRSDWAFCPSCGRRTPAADVLDPT